MTMKTTKWMGASTLALAALAAAACSDGTSPELADDAVLEAVAVVAADATLEDVSVMSTPLLFGGGGPGAVGGFGPGGSFEGARTVTFFDGNGGEQEAYDPLTTASIHIEVEIQAEVEREYWTASVHRIRNLTVSGLEGEETTRQWDGTGSQQVARSRHLEDGTEYTFEMAGSFVIEAVVVPVPGTSDTPWPLSGSITRTIHVSGVGPDGEFGRTVEITILFDGDDTATAVVDGETYEIDLTAGHDGFPLRHRRHHNGG